LVGQDRQYEDDSYAVDFDPKGRFVTASDDGYLSLDLYIAERVKELARGQQSPTTTKPATVPDFPIAVRQ
jgi:hypothetical protein